MKRLVCLFCGVILCATVTVSFAEGSAKKASSPVVVAKATLHKRAVKHAVNQEGLAAQKALNKSGDKLIEDGEMGPKTMAALKKFQKANGLKVTGRINAPTLAKLGIK